MAFCPYCGTKLEDGASFCPNCGKKLDAQKNSQKTDFTEDLKKLADTPDTTANYTAADIEQNKLMGVLCYLSILWLIPFFTRKDSPFVKYHLNQGLIVLILGIIAGAISFIPIVGWLCDVIVFALAIIGIINVANGRAQELPVVGKFRLLS